MSIKQIIVIRKDLNMRKGKMIAQGCHASLECFLNDYIRNKSSIEDRQIDASDELMKWYIGDKTKIALSVDSKEELLEIYEESIDEGLNTYLVKDLGYTEFDEPTYTAVGIGPDYSEKIDKVTGDLDLL